MASWNIIFQLFYPRLYAIALERSKNKALAADIVQETFITAYLKLHQLKEAAAFGGWIKQILLHLYSRSSQNTKEQISIDQVELKGLKWSENEVEKKLDWVSTKSNLYATVALLPELLRTTLLLRYFSTYSSYGEIAQIQRIPVGTVRSRLNQAKSKLTELWKQPMDNDVRILNEAETWNRFYFNTLSLIHSNEQDRHYFLSHLGKGVKVVTAASNTIHDRGLFEKMVHEDIEVGSWLDPVKVISSGDLSIIETKHFNSAEFPDHCPPASIMIVYRNHNKVNKLQILPL